MAKQSPCVYYCMLKDGLCPACGRTLEEIETWMVMTPEQKAKACESAKARVEELKKTGAFVEYS